MTFRGLDPLAVLGQIVQMHHQRINVALDHGHCRRVGGAVVGEDRLQPTLDLGRGADLINGLPPARLELGLGALGELGGVEPALTPAAVALAASSRIPDIVERDETADAKVSSSTAPHPWSTGRTGTSPSPYPSRLMMIKVVLLMRALVGPRRGTCVAQCSGITIDLYRWTHGD